MRAKEVGKREEKRIIMWKKNNYIHVLSIIIVTGTVKTLSIPAKNRVESTEDTRMVRFIWVTTLA